MGGAKQPRRVNRYTLEFKLSAVQLRGLSRPQYRLRIDEIRVSYDITGTTVEILAIVPKPEAQRWLAQFGNLE